MYHSKNQWEEETLECDDVSKTSSDISFWMGEFPLSTNQSTIISLIIMTSFSPKMHFFSALDSGVSGTPHKINFQKLSPNTNALSTTFFDPQWIHSVHILRHNDATDDCHDNICWRKREYNRKCYLQYLGIPNLQVH